MIRQTFGLAATQLDCLGPGVRIPWRMPKLHMVGAGGGNRVAGALARPRRRSGGLALRCGHNFRPRDDAWRGGLSNRFRGALDVKEAGLVFLAVLVLQPVLGYLDFGRDQPVALGGEVFCWPCCRGWASPADKRGDHTSMRDVGLAAGGQGQEG